MANLSVRERISSFLVKNEEGLVDVEATRAKFDTSLLDYVATQSGNDESIKLALTKLFDEHHGARLNQQAIATLTRSILGDMNPDLKDPKLVTPLMKRIIEVLKVETKAGVYVSTQGPSGGTARVVDLPVKEDAATPASK